MQFDDRLATVLRMQAGSERAGHTQFRQLLDLVGSAPAGADESLLEEAYSRLGALSGAIEPEKRAAMVREPGQRLRNPELVAFLAGQEAPVAAAAMASARLREDLWEALLPALPPRARALLRYREDLPEGTKGLLARLGVLDLGLPEPEEEPAIETEVESEAILDLDPALEIDGDSGAGIGALVRRIEAFQRARHKATTAHSSDAPRLPLDEQHLELKPRRPQAFDFATDAEGRIKWADPALAPMTVGLMLASRQPDAPARADAAMATALRLRQPIRNGRLELIGAPAIAGEWRVDAAPHFTVPGGAFAGYRGRMRRPSLAIVPAPAKPTDTTPDRIRQMLHELRTPVNAIQGFAEVIQQQLFGPTPNEYRALAAAIAGDAARMLAGFEELDRLAKLESGAMELDEGTSDFRAIVTATAAQLDSVLRPRSAGLEMVGHDMPCPVALAKVDAELLAWRLIATLAGATSPGEELQVVLVSNGIKARLEIDLPAALASREDIFQSGASVQAQAVTSGMFGAGFTLRLARAEARAAGGDLVRDDDMLGLTLPLAKPPAENPGGDMDYDGKMSDTG